MKIFSNEEIKDIERITIEEDGVTALELIENVALDVATEVKTGWRTSTRLFILAGWGNNGADALETARLLAQGGYRPEVYLFNIGNRITPECQVMRDRLLEEPNATLYEITGSEAFTMPEPTADSIVIDGLFGSGLNNPLPRSFQMLAQIVNRSQATVISIDIPSGLGSDWNGNTPREDMMHATLTMAVGFPRMSFFLSDNAKVVGDWQVIDPGYSRSAIARAPFSFAVVDRTLVKRFLLPRDKFAGKNAYGSALLFAGSQGMAGAAVLAARGALRAGAGKVTVHGPSACCGVLQTAVPASMFDCDPNATHITRMDFKPTYQAVGVGPGIGTAPATVEAVEKLFKAATAAGARLVIDADALNAIAQRPAMLSYLTPLSVLTPHPGEFDRIFKPSENDEERLRKAIRAAEDYNLIIVLKGRYTAIVRPDGRVMFNTSGTPALATPGSGDVLTGVITGLMAQGIKSEVAAFMGCYIHGIAGEMAAAKHGEYGVMADDVAMHVGAAIQEIMNDER